MFAAIKEAFKALAGEHADWYCTQIHATYVTAFEHGGKHEYEMGYNDGFKSGRLQQGIPPMAPSDKAVFPSNKVKLCPFCRSKELGSNGVEKEIHGVTGKESYWEEIICHRCMGAFLVHSSKEAYENQ